MVVAVVIVVAEVAAKMVLAFDHSGDLRSDNDDGCGSGIVNGTGTDNNVHSTNWNGR